MNYSNYKKVNITDVADFERAQNGKIYKGGCTLIGVSACTSSDGQLRYLETSGRVESKWAVVVPKDITDGRYLNIVITRAFPEFFNKMHQTINLPVNNIRYLAVEWHMDKAARDDIAKQCEVFDAMIRQECHTIEKLQKVKKFFLGKMMCTPRPSRAHR